MILPTTYLAGLLVLIFSMVAWGSWANTQKMLGRWRFELFYYDFSIGAVFCAVAAAFTLGSWNSQELTFQDSLLITGYRNMAYAAGAGMVLNLANILLVGAISVSGLALAFPIGFGLALIVGVAMNYIGNPQGSAMLLFGGAFLLLLAIILNASAHSSHVGAQRAAARKAAAAPSEQGRPAAIARPPR